MKRSRAGFWLPGLIALCLAPGARAADEALPAEAPTSEIGRSIFVVNDVDGQAGEAPAKRLAVNDDIVFDEDITTAADAKTVIEFRDGSTFEVGPDAVVRIDSFVFNAEESISHKTLQVTRGVFRYVSGVAAADQDTKITSPSGALAIRGSVVAGIVDPSVPDFVYVGEGSAIFTNAAGSSNLQPGSAIAVPSASTPPMEAAAMPAPVAAQALAVIDTRLPPREALRNRPAADEAWLKRQGAANLVPAAEQAQRAGGAGRRPLPNPGAHGSLAGELGLLVDGNRVDLFQGGHSARTPGQTAFLARAARENPAAAVAMRRYTTEARVLHSENRTVATRTVIRGVGRAASSPEVMRRVTEASVRANPGSAALIRQHATESYHREINRPPSAHTPPEPREGRTAAPPPHQQKPAPNQAARKTPAQKQPVKKPPEKKPPPKKGAKDEKDKDKEQH